MPSIETSVASVIFQERMTLSPGLMLSGVAVMVAVGAVPVSAAGGGGGGGGACFLPHPANAATIRTARQEAERRRILQVRIGSGFTVSSPQSETVARSSQNGRGNSDKYTFSSGASSCRQSVYLGNRLHTLSHALISSSSPARYCCHHGSVHAVAFRRPASTISRNFFH